MPSPLVVTIILNTSRRDDTLACLASLIEGKYENHKIIVLDNASTDGSIAAIQTQYPNVEILELSENEGYAGNNNVGIEAALAYGADWVFVLNEDTILAPDCISKLVAVGESDPQIGIVGPMVYHHNEPDAIQSAGGALTRYWEGYHIAENEPDTGQLADPCEVDWIHGCGIMLRGTAVSQVGMLDTRFFYYWEETEWSIRIKKAGWRIIHVPDAKLWHKGVQRDYQPSPNITYYNTRNRLLALSKHNAPFHVRLHAWAQIARTLTSWTIKPKWRHMRDHRSSLWQGASDYLRKRWGIRPS